jgi:hypothetical protein
MNDLLFYTLIAFLIYIIFFHKKSTEHFIDTKPNYKRNNRECSDLSINNSMFDYITSYQHKHQ